jgi:FkbM family methyltransferase
MSAQPSSVTPEQARAALAAGAAQFESLAALRATGAVGRWAACQSATANYHAPHVVQAPTFWGGRMEVDIRETVSSEVFIHGVFEPELSSFFHDHLRPGQTFVDVGAHYGYFSLLAAHRVGPEGRVVSIEPCERTSWRLYRNTKDLPQVRIHRLAAWEKEEMLTLHDYGPLYSAFNSIGERRIHESAPAVKGTPFEIRAVALDDFFEENGIAPDVIKIDAESAEIQVLRGLARTLRTRRPIITLEVGDYEHLLAKGGISSAEVLRMIAEHGYALLSPGVGSITAHEIRSERNYDYGNVVAVPSERAGEFIR